jgi:O-antigen/teichoic acid export membrane protein
MRPDADAPAGARAPRGLPTTFLSSMAVRLATVGVNAITGVVTARALSPSGRGELAAMVLWPMLFAGLTTVGLPSALVYHLRREEASTPRLIGWALALCTAASLAGTVIGWPLIPVWLGHHPPEVIRGAQWCLLTTLLCSLTLTARAAWEARGRFVTSALSQLLTPLMVLAGLGVLQWRGGLTATAAAAVYVLAGLPSLIWMVTSLTAHARPTLDGATQPWRRLSHYGLRSYGVDLCGILAIYLDQALVVGLLSAASMGIYAVALSLSRVIGAVHAAVATMVFPRVVGLAPDVMVGALGRSARLGTIASAAVGVPVLAAGPMLITWLYGPAYAPAGVILPILLAEAVVAGLAQVLLQGFLAAGRPGVATVVLGLGLAGSVPLFLVLVPAFGVTGAAVALLGGSLLRVAFTVAAYRTVLRVAAPRLWFSGDDRHDLVRYGGALASSVARLRAAGGVK